MEKEEYERPDSSQLLRRLQFEEEEKLKKSRGKLKIFLGYAAGSGKTYAMLKAAHEAKKHHIDVVAGYVEPHARPDTQALVKGLETIAPMEIAYKGVKLREFDLDAALKRNPRLILVDELAHTNVKGCRNEKRYQDVKELLRAGIDVYTTMNIQHLESLNDIVGNVTHIEVRERVPDKVFDHADQVEVIDIEPEELIERMKEGKIYGPLQAERALENFFRREKLVALREITLRRTADRVNRIAEEERNALGEMDYHTGEHVLVCISPSPSNAKVIRTASRLAYAFHASFTGIYVETPKMQEADEKTKAAVKNHMDLARALGADIVTVYGTDIAYQIVEYAIVGNISKIVMGRSRKQWMFGKSRSEVLEQLTYRAPNIDVYIIPDMKHTKEYREKGKSSEKKEESGKKVLLELGEITAIMALSTMAAYIFQWFRLSEANLIMVYMVGVLLSSYVADKKIYALYSALLSMLSFNFFFTEPYFSLKAYDKGSPVTFAMLFAVGFFMASMTRQLKAQTRESAKKAYRTEILLENSRKLRRCRTREEVWKQVAAQVEKLLNLSIIIYPVDKKGNLEEPMLFPRKGMGLPELKENINGKERAVAQWAASNRHRAGTCTHTLPDANAMYLPVQSTEEVKGVMGILLEERRPVKDFEYGLLIAMLNETGVKLQDTFLEKEIKLN
ncbi:sensor histidine kinase KdpD [Blautia producta]|nr:sensor histidine kinase KdpD [Blautia producta]NSG15399.1 sensor histidine kinase KdpD [Blautia producta]NSJ75592.1 sensor histidine kinase KdpD [Blautia producta]